MKRRKIFSGLAMLGGISILVGGCVTFTSAPADPDVLNSPLFEPLTSGEQVTLNVVSVNGVAAPGDSLDRAVAGFERFISGELRVTHEEPVTLDLGEDGAISPEQVAAIMAGTKDWTPSNILLIIAPDFESFEDAGHSEMQGIYDSGYVLRDIDPGPHLIQVSGMRIERDHPTIPLAYNREDAWHFIIAHELFHSLGIPSSKTHAWYDGHCTRPACVLYPPVGYRFWTRSILRFGVAYEPCAVCQGEIEASQAAVAPGEAFDWYDRTVDLNPDDPRVYLKRAVRAWRQNDNDAAIEDYDQVLERRPEDANAYYGRGLARKNLGNQSGAMEDLEAAVRIDPEHVAAMEVLANVLISSDEPDRAVAMATRACDVTSWEKGRFVRGLGLAHWAKGDAVSAMENFEKAIALDEDDYRSYGVLAWILATAPDDSVRSGVRAVEYATQACKLTEWENGSCLDTLACAYAEAGDFESAVRYANEAIALTDGEDLREYQGRLDLFTAGKPFRTEK